MFKVKKVPTPSEYGPLDMILKGTRRLAQHRIKKSLPVTPPYPEKPPSIHYSRTLPPCVSPNPTNLQNSQSGVLSQYASFVKSHH